MELIRISDRKLKIMLTPTDMRQFELNADTFGEDSVQMHRSFKLLLEEVKKQTGFEADDRQLSVQYFPSREGGCEMFISRLPIPEERGDESHTGHTGRALQLRQKLRCGSFHKECAYRFDTLERLLSVCQRLLTLGYIGSNCAYRDDSSYYYLFLSSFVPSPFMTPEELSFIVEYGSIENASTLKIYLREHGHLICSENAVYQLGRLK